MDGSRGRRFTIFDAMALVAATALGLAFARHVESPISLPGTRYDFLLYWPWSEGPSSIAMAWTLALVLLQLFHSRGWRTTSIVEPGSIACVASLAAMVLGAGRLAVVDLLDRNPSSLAIFPAENYWDYATDHIPETVAGAWLSLRLGGRWSAVPSWIDRTGRLLGFYWIARRSSWFVEPILAIVIPGR
jgi:hypothetical protein